MAQILAISRFITLAVKNPLTINQVIKLPINPPINHLIDSSLEKIDSAYSYFPFKIIVVLLRCIWCSHEEINGKIKIDTFVFIL